MEQRGWSASNRISHDGFPSRNRKSTNEMSDQTMKRREFIQGTLMIAGVSMLPRWAFAQASGNQVVYIFMRGGADALSIVPSLNTLIPTYRPSIATVNPIYYNALALHPQLAPLIN